MQAPAAPVSSSCRHTNAGLPVCWSENLRRVRKVPERRSSASRAGTAADRPSTSISLRRNFSKTQFGWSTWLADWRTQFRSASGWTPSWSATRLIAPRADSGSFLASNAIRVARCWSSTLYFLGAAITIIILPRIESLHQTRGDSPQGHRVVVQCKRYARSRGVSSTEMQLFVGMAWHEHSADISLYVTTARYTAEAQSRGTKRCLHSRSQGAWQVDVGRLGPRRSRGANPNAPVRRWSARHNTAATHDALESDPSPPSRSADFAACQPIVASTSPGNASNTSRTNLHASVPARAHSCASYSRTKFSSGSRSSKPNSFITSPLVPL